MIIIHILKHLIASCLIWFALNLSNVNFSVLSCIILGLTMAWLEWIHKIWMLRQVETATLVILKKINSNH